MRLLDLTLPTPAENLALDEALLEEAEANAADVGILRIWESSHPLVVVGRSSRVQQEARVEACNAFGIPILRRCSGGAAIVTGPGCLMYAAVLSYRRYPHLQAIDQAHRFVLGIVADALRSLGLAVELSGTSDLTLAGRKFSGNSLRCKRSHLLYHGTLLYDFRLELIETCLGTPPRQPEYRSGRNHAEFVRNLHVDRAALRNALIDGWNAEQTLDTWPAERTAELVRTRYAREDWNRCRE